MKLKHRTALVVGGGTGLGRAIALALANEGAHVAVADRDSAAADATVALLPSDSQARAYQLDIVMTEAIKDTIGAVVKRFGRLDIMVNCAAICFVDPLLELTPERWEQVFAVNTRGAFFCMQAAANAMVPNKSGRIITISSPASKVAVPLFATYGASKAAIDSLTKSAAIAWAPHGITVNTIARCSEEGSPNLFAAWAPVDFLGRILLSIPCAREISSIARSTSASPVNVGSGPRPVPCGGSAL